MPYQQTYVSAPKDMTMPLYKGTANKPPFGYTLWWELYGVANAVHLLTRESIYFCERCEGWVDGRPNEYGVHTLGILCGRDGVEFHCRRCGNEIAFFGKMA